MVPRLETLLGIPLRCPRRPTDRETGRLDRDDQEPVVHRGWTLQELLAPKWVDFFDAEWNIIGDKEELVDTIHDITGIDRLSLISSHH